MEKKDFLSSQKCKVIRMWSPFSQSRNNTETKSSMPTIQKKPAVQTSILWEHCASCTAAKDREQQQHHTPLWLLAVKQQTSRIRWLITSEIENDVLETADKCKSLSSFGEHIQRLTKACALTAVSRSPERQVALCTHNMVRPWTAEQQRCSPTWVMRRSRDESY